MFQLYFVPPSNLTLTKNVLFRSGVFTLISGKNINSKDRNSILIHLDLAKKNHLKVGGTICLNSHTFTIKGIFEGKKHGKRQIK